MKGGKTPVVVGQSHSRKAIERQLRSITKVINSAVTAAEIDFDSRVQQLESCFNELYHAPGMPGFVRAQAEWEGVTRANFVRNSAPEVPRGGGAPEVGEQGSPFGAEPRTNQVRRDEDEMMEGLQI